MAGDELRLLAPAHTVLPCTPSLRKALQSLPSHLHSTPPCLPGGAICSEGQMPHAAMSLTFSFSLCWFCFGLFFLGQGLLMALADPDLEILLSLSPECLDCRDVWPYKRRLWNFYKLYLTQQLNPCHSAFPYPQNSPSS